MAFRPIYPTQSPRPDDVGQSRDTSARASLLPPRFTGTSSNPDRPPDSSSGDGKGEEEGGGDKKKGRPKGSKGRNSSLSSAPLSTPANPGTIAPNEGDIRGRNPSEEDRLNARKLFREIGSRFNENRKKSKSSAYAQYRHDLMANMDVLVLGGAIDLKEITSVITQLEGFTRETEGGQAKSQSQILAEWLRIPAAELEPRSDEPSEDAKD